PVCAPLCPLALHGALPISRAILPLTGFDPEDCFLRGTELRPEKSTTKSDDPRSTERRPEKSARHVRKTPINKARETTHLSDYTSDRKSTRLNSSHVKISYA